MLILQWRLFWSLICVAYNFVSWDITLSEDIMHELVGITSRSHRRLFCDLLVYTWHILGQNKASHKFPGLWPGLCLDFHVWMTSGQRGGGGGGDCCWCELQEAGIEPPCVTGMSLWLVVEGNPLTDQCTAAGKRPGLCRPQGTQSQPRGLAMTWTVRVHKALGAPKNTLFLSCQWTVS